MEDLLVKKCVPCNMKELRPMTEEAANTLMPQVPEWNLVNEGGILKLQKTYKVKTFLKGLEFFQLVAGVAEAEGIISILKEANTSPPPSYIYEDQTWDVKEFLYNVGHHPDLHLSNWNNVQIDLWTHAVGGLTENDFILAAKIGRLDAHHILRKSIANELQRFIGGVGKKTDVS